MASKLATLSMPPKNQSEPARTRRKPVIKLRYVAVGVVLVWGCYHYLHVQHAQYVALQRQAQQLTAKLQSEQSKSQELAREVKEFNDNDFIARYASQHLDLIEPGQVPFVVNQQQH